MAKLSDAERYFLDVNGFLVRRGVLKPLEVERLQRCVDELNVQPGTTIASQRFTGHLVRDPAFRALIDHPAVFDVVRELCGPLVRLDHTYGIVMAPGTRGLDLHGGAVPFDPSQFWVADGTGVHAGLVAALWSLSRAEDGDGGFACIPGSHKAAFALPTGVGVDGPWSDWAREVPLGRGDLLLFAEALTHGTLPWAGREERRLLVFKYSPGNSSWARELTVGDDLLTLLSPRQRLLVEPPYVAYRRAP